MQRTIKYIGWPIETKNHKTTTTTKIGKNKPKTETHKTKWETRNRKTLPENRNTKSQNWNKHPQQELQTDSKTDSKNTNHSHKRRKQKQGNSVKLYSFSCFIVFFILNVFFRENMIAGYYYLGTSNCKSISFPGYLFSLSPLAPGDRFFHLWGFRSILPRRGVHARTTWGPFLDRPGSAFASPKQTT